MHQRNNFDGLRLIAALMVLYSHQFALMGQSEPKPLGPYTLGTLGVVFFFTISGFLITQSWLNDPDITRYSLRRALRIWPALFINVTVLGVLAAIFSPDVRFVAIKFIISNTFFIRFDSYFFSNKYPQLNGPLWTIPIEVLCYLLLALMALASKNKLQYALGFFVSAFLLVILQYSDSEIQQMAHASGDPTLAPWLYALFAMGALHQCNKKLTRWWPLFFIVALILSAINKYTASIIIAAAPAIIIIGQKSWPILRNASQFGDLSYGIYLWAWPVQQILISTLGKQKPFWLLFSMTLIITITIAYISWHCIEKIALRYKPTRANKNSSPK